MLDVRIYYVCYQLNIFSKFLHREGVKHAVFRTTDFEDPFYTLLPFKTINFLLSTPSINLARKNQQEKKLTLEFFKNIFQCLTWQCHKSVKQFPRKIYLREIWIQL